MEPRPILSVSTACVCAEREWRTEREHGGEPLGRRARRQHILIRDVCGSSTSRWTSGV